MKTNFTNNAGNSYCTLYILMTVQDTYFLLFVLILRGLSRSCLVEFVIVYARLELCCATPCSCRGARWREHITAPLTGNVNIYTWTKPFSFEPDFT